LQSRFFHHLAASETNFSHNTSSDNGVVIGDYPDSTLMVEQYGSLAQGPN
jgi:hypothetical protein